MYTTIADLGGWSVQNVLIIISLAVPWFFALFCFIFWIAVSGGVYFASYNYSGKRKFFSSLVASSFVTMLLSVLLALNNSLEYVILDGLWVVFYIVVTIASYMLLTYYK